MDRFIHNIQRKFIAKFLSKKCPIPHILRIRTYSFRVFSVYKQIHSGYFQYMYRFCVLRECAQIILNIWNGIIFFAASKGTLLQEKEYVCVQLNQRPTKNNRLFISSLIKKNSFRVL